MAETYELTGYADGGAVKSALDKAGTALQAGDVVNALDSTATDAPLSAAQGKALNDGKVTGPASATDNAIARFDGQTGKLLQDGANATLADNGALTIATGAVTDSQPMLDLSQTWNDAADTFTGIKANVTDTASASGSLLMDLQVGGSSRFKVGKVGSVTIASSFVAGESASFLVSATGNRFSVGAVFCVSESAAQGPVIHGGGYLGWFSSTVGINAPTPDLTLYRDAANTLAQRNGTNAQESRLYGSYTSATAYQRLSTKTIREAVTCAAGASVTTTISIPKYTHLIGVTTRVTTELVGESLTGYTVGDGSDPDLWGAVTGKIVGTDTDADDYTNIAALGPAATDRTITLTATGAEFAGGVIEVCAYYLCAEAA